MLDFNQANKCKTVYNMLQLLSRFPCYKYIIFSKYAVFIYHEIVIVL